VSEHIDLTPFLGDEAGRYGLDKEARFGGYRWATDGRILIRVPDADALGSKPETFADVEGMMEDYAFTRDCAEELPPPVIVMGECTSCPKCLKCQGEGWIMCTECGHERECEICKGDGVTANCGVCGGTQRAGVEDRQKIGAGWISGLLLSKMRKLSGLRIKPLEHPEKPTSFIADGGVEGLVAPTRGR
jgi:hypothetical protein